MAKIPDHITIPVLSLAGGTPSAVCPVPTGGRLVLTRIRSKLINGSGATSEVAIRAFDGPGSILFQWMLAANGVAAGLVDSAEVDLDDLGVVLIGPGTFSRPTVTWSAGVPAGGLSIGTIAATYSPESSP